MNAYSPKSAEAPWHTTAEAQALLASCAANPPSMVTDRAPLSDWFGGGDEYTLVYWRGDDRVDALRRLSDAASSCDLPREVLRNWPRVGDVIAQAIAAGERKVAA